MTAHLLLLCHAATASARTAGFPLDDEPLDPVAEARLRRFRGRVRHSDRQLASPLPRAFGTGGRARPLARRRNPVSPIATTDAGGAGRYRRRNGASRKASRRGSRIPTKAPHGGESISDLIVRMRDWLAGQAAVSGVTLAVTHASVVRAALVAALDAEPRAFWRIDVAPLSMARLSGRAGRWNLVGLGALEMER